MPPKNMQFCPGTTIFSKATYVLKPADLGCKYGSRATKMWLPGIGNSCSTHDTKKSCTMCYLVCTFYLGRDDVYTKKVSIQATKIWLPPSNIFLPENIMVIELNELLEGPNPIQPSLTQAKEDLMRPLLYLLFQKGTSHSTHSRSQKLSQQKFGSNQNNGLSGMPWSCME